jgi:hypothetical protein
LHTRVIKYILCYLSVSDNINLMEEERGSRVWRASTWGNQKRLKLKCRCATNLELCAGQASQHLHPDQGHGRAPGAGKLVADPRGGGPPLHK